MVNSYRFLAISLIWCVAELHAQKTDRPYRGGFVCKDLTELKSNYAEFWNHLNVKKGEDVASVGVQNGYIEVAISVFVDNIHWVLQDIDTTYLNKKNFNDVLHYHEKLKGSKIVGDFSMVIGSQTKTNLAQNSFDRIIMPNVYHELSDRESMMADITKALKQNGELVIMERMASKRGKKHGDCKMPQLWEPEFLDEMESFNLKMVSKVVPSKKYPITFYTFNKI